MIFVSTTYRGHGRSHLNTVLKELNTLEIDGVEIGSTHTYETKQTFARYLKQIDRKKIIIHNFFPPKKNQNFVLNIASDQKKIRNESIDFFISGIDFAKKVGAKLYTIHPGFLSDAKPNIIKSSKNYDFNFKDKILEKKLAYQFLFKSLKKLINYSKLKKIRLAVETEGSSLKYKYLMMQRPSEYINLFKTFPSNLYINLNIAHTIFASKIFKFSLNGFIKKFKHKVAAIELSCNDGFLDQHLPITPSSENLKYIKYFKNIPIILEYRNTNFQNLKKSIEVLKENYD